jgi:DNA modification methylase
MSEPRPFPIPIATDEEVAAFIRQYGRLYDPETDDYHREPFIADIREGKNDPIYNAHSYHTKVPPRAIIPYILHYTEPGDLILDPFCGSGMTGVAALMCEDPPEDILQAVPGAKKGARRAILNDLSPAACHIAYNYCTPVDVDALKAEFERIKAAVKEEFDWLYGTEHYEPAVGLYDPSNPEVACRLKNPPAGVGVVLPLPEEERTWELLERSEVERRMGADALAKQPLPEGVSEFVCIPATIQYTIWSDVYKCQGFVTVEEPTGRTNKKTGKAIVKKVRRPRGCGADIVLWHAAVEHETGKVREVFACPNCGQQWKKIQLKRAATLPVLTCYQHQTSSSSKNKERALAAIEIERLREIDTRPIPWRYPDMPIDTDRPQYHRNALSARKVKNLTDFYTRRNLWALGSLWNEAIATRAGVRGSLLFVLTSTFGRIEKMTRYVFKKGGNCSLRGQLYFPSFAVENNLLKQFRAKLSHVAKCFESLLAYGNADRPGVTCSHAGCMKNVESNSIDYVFTDPPFGSNIYYTEVNWLYECWLGRFTETALDAVVHRRNDRGTKVIKDYKRLMSEAFGEMHRVLKPGRFATIVFNNSDGGVFESIKDSVRNAGLLIENMLFLDKEQKTFKQIKGGKGEEDVVGHDVVFNLRKPATVPAPGRRVRQGTANDPNVEHLVAETIRDHLRRLPARIQAEPKTYSDEHRSTPFLNTMLMNALIPRGVDVSRLNLPFIEQVCGRYFRKVDNRWYLRDETVGNQRPNGGPSGLFPAPDEEVTVQDETSAIEWLRQKLTKTPMRIGELRPHWMRATVKLTSDLSTRLDQYLREHFWLDRRTRRWREPTDEERALMDTSERQQARYDAERFLAGHLRRHPPDAEVLDWIEHLYRSASLIEEEAAGLSDTGVVEELPQEAAKLYGMMPKLFQGVLKEQVHAAKYALAQRRCRIASAKLAEQAEREGKRRAAESAEDLPLFRQEGSK